MGLLRREVFRSREEQGHHQEALGTCLESPLNRKGEWVTARQHKVQESLDSAESRPELECPQPVWVVHAGDFRLPANALRRPMDLEPESQRGWLLTPGQSIPVSRAPAF